MKLIFDSLDSLLTELRDRKVQVVRISPAIHLETGARTAGVPHLTSRIVVTAALDEQLWAEWRYWVGRGPAEVGDQGLHVPEALRTKARVALADISRQIDGAGFPLRDGMLAPDAAALDSFRL
jgi:hypothetical protein